MPRPNVGVPGKWWRHKKTGKLFPFTEAMRGNPAVEEVTDEMAFPEKYIPKKQKKRKSKLDLGTDDKAVAKAKPKRRRKPELEAEISRGL